MWQIKFVVIGQLFCADTRINDSNFFDGFFIYV